MNRSVSVLEKQTGNKLLKDASNLSQTISPGQWKSPNFKQNMTGNRYSTNSPHGLDETLQHVLKPRDPKLLVMNQTQSGFMSKGSLDRFAPDTGKETSLDRASVGKLSTSKAPQMVHRDHF